MTTHNHIVASLHVSLRNQQVPDQCTWHGLYWSPVLSLSVIYVIFIISLQITELQKDQVKVAMATIEKVLANPDKETAELIKAAQEDYKS